MRAHTITTKARVGARGRKKRTIVPRGILALSLAAALLAATASTASTRSTAPGDTTAALTVDGVTTPTPPAPPLTLIVGTPRAAQTASKVWPEKNKLPFYAITNNDSTLVARGDVKKTTEQLAAGEETKIKARLKHLKRLKERIRDLLDPGRKPEKPRYPKVKIKVAATDEFGQTATDELRVKLCTKQVNECGGGPQAL